MGLWSRIRSINLDALLSYKTVKVVRIQDRRLGILHLLVQMIIVGYIIGYVFFWKGGYLEREETYGLVTTKTKGQTSGFVQMIPGKSRSSHAKIDTDGVTRVYLDAADVIQPAIEPNSVFIATRIQETLGQTLDWCVNEIPNECNMTHQPHCYDKHFGEGRCEDGYCKYFQWCPTENEQTFPNNQTSMTTLTDVGNLTIWFKAAIEFPHLLPNVAFSTIKQQNPIKYSEDPINGNLFSVNELLALTTNSNFSNTYASVRDKGAIIKMDISWDCNLDKANGGDIQNACSLDYTAIRLDNETINDGFNFRQESYHWVTMPDGTLQRTRDLTKFYGIRLFITSKGIGYKVSIVQIVLQLSSALALLSLATVVADVIMVYLLPERKNYESYKVFRTPKLYISDTSSSDSDANRLSPDGQSKTIKQRRAKRSKRENEATPILHEDAPIAVVDPTDYGLVPEDGIQPQATGYYYGTTADAADESASINRQQHYQADSSV